jgi:Glycyl-tRNA synthetase (class II)
MDKLVALCKGRGFIFAGSEVYGGLANTWDYGPLGVELKNNIKKAWWQKFVAENRYNVGVDCAILMNPKVWEASGHLGGFSDPLMDCKACKSRHRADNLIEDYNKRKGIELNIACWSNEQMEAILPSTKYSAPSAAMPILLPFANSI